MRPAAVVAGRAALAVAVIALVVAQCALPGLAQHLGGAFWETAPYVGPYALAGILAIGAAQVGLIVLGWLLGRVGDARWTGIGTLRGLRTLAVSAVVAAWIPAITILHLLVVVGVGGPGFLLILGALMVGGLTAVLLVGAWMRSARAAHP